MSWGRGQEEEVSLGRMVEEIDDDEILSPVPLTSVLPMARSSPWAELSGDKGFFPFEVNEKQLKDWHRTYMIPDNIEFFVSGPNDWADDQPLGCVALNQVVLATGLRFPFPRIVKKFLHEWRIAPT
ncbi:Uncharacterized protein Adt_09954 [Abeliophyllum distichum]|uniref:Uncharacterized protein n=1 Tax=Abeliophyllum distichum TaxID=126358 RepID=A0ABD1UK23_9LAMI